MGQGRTSRTAGQRKNDLVNFKIVQGVEFVAVPFIQNAAEVELVREVLGVAGEHQILSKIEYQEGLVNFDEFAARPTAP